MDSHTVMQACEACFDANSDNCSGFVKAVAAMLGVTLTDQADDIVDQIDTSPWTTLVDGGAAKQQADSGLLVIGGLRGADNEPPQTHGHVVVVVSGPLDPTHNAYPLAYWGKLGAVGQKKQFVNFAWNSASRDKVIYACIAY